MWLCGYVAIANQRTDSHPCIRFLHPISAPLPKVSGQKRPGGTPFGILSGPGVQPFVAKMLIGTGFMENDVAHITTLLWDALPGRE